MSDPPSEPVVPEALDRAAAIAWRVLVVGAAIGATGWVLLQMRIVLLPLIVATLLTRVLHPVTRWLRRHRWPGALADAAVVLSFVALMILGAILLGRAAGDEAGELGDATAAALDDVERWIVEDSPFDVDEEQIAEVRTEAGEAIGRWLRTSGDSIIAGVVLAGELLLGGVLGLVITFFLLRDGDRFGQWALRRLPARRRPLAARLGERAWSTLGGFLRGAALLGLTEGIIVTVTMSAVGASLAVPVGVATFVLAFVPIAGAIVAGLVAVLVALSTAGPTAAIIVGVVMLAVQQFDNDLLAPVIYGSQLDLHPVVILLASVTGASLFGIPGAVVAVPLTAVVIGVASEARDAAIEGELAAPADAAD